MKKKTVFGAVLLALLMLQAHTVFAKSSDFVKALGSGNYSRAESILRKEVSGYSSDERRQCFIAIVNRFPNNEVAKWLDMFPNDSRRFGGHSLTDAMGISTSGGIPNKVAINYLISNGIKPRPIDVLFSGTGNIDFDIFVLFLRNVTDINERFGEFNRSLLMAFASMGNLNIVRLLVENGARVNLRDNDGATAASLAYDKGEIEIYNYLKENGAIDFEPRQVAQPTAPAPVAPSSTTNVYVQPSAPAQSTSQSPAIPTLQVGTYAASGTNHTMSLIRISDTSGTVNYYVGGGLAAGSGTYRISNNQLSLSFGPLSSNEGLKNKTFIYNITSSTSFSGSGETWARTGY